MMLEGLYIQQRRSGEWLVGSAGGRHALVGSEVLVVVSSLERSATLEDAYATYRQKGGVLDAARFGSCAEECMALLGEQAGIRYQNIRLRWRLLSPEWTEILAVRLAPLFRWPGAVAASVLALFASALALAAILGGSALSDTAASGAGIFGLVVFGILLHELGHAAALRSTGEPPGEIGFGLYYGFLPMFYSGLSRAWRLGRAARVKVNLGGLYLQIAYAGGLLLLAAAMPEGGAIHATLQQAAHVTVAAAALQLIPLSGTDGYWVLADLLDEPALARYESSLGRDALRGRDAVRKRALVRIGYLLFSWSLLLASLSMALRSAWFLLHEAAAWLGGAAAGAHLRNVNGWLSLLIAALLLKRLFAQAFQLLKGAPQTPEEASCPTAAKVKGNK